MEEEQQRKIAQFCSITGVNVERAGFYLSAANWDTTLAVSTFFESEGHDSDDAQLDESESRTEQPQASDEEEAPSAPRSGPTSGPSRIQTFASWGSSNRENDEGEEGQAYYAGGSEESGQQILGPSRKKKDKEENIVEKMFKAAKEHGAEVVSESERSSDHRKPPTYFAGTGYRLGESESEPSQSVRGTTKPTQPLNVTLRLWKTGFTVNDEPLRLYSDPTNREFLKSVQKGEIPQELISRTTGAEVSIDMEDHREEDYQPPKQPKVQVFSGQGQTLAGPSDTQASTSSSVVTSAQQVVVDSSQPVTNVQIRLHDGSRLVAKFNHSHTIGEVRQHVAALRPELAGVAFTLLTTMPSRQLTDDSLTLKQADLLNAVIMLKR